MSKKVLLFSIIVFLEFVVISFLGFKIYEKKKNVLGEVYVNPIKRENLIFKKSEKLKYFYEPKANSVLVISESWLPNKVINTINSDTLHERFEYSIEKSQEVYRIITLGDSFTYGENVFTKDNWTELLEDKLSKLKSCNNIKKFEVINLGVYGYDAAYVVERFKIRGIKYNPDLVIWTFADYERILEKMFPDILKYKEYAEKLESKGIYYENWEIARKNLKDRIGVKGFADELTKQLNKFSEMYKGNLLLLAMPSTREYINMLKDFKKNRVNTYFAQVPIDWNEKKYFLSDLHFNKSGHKVMSNFVYKYLKTNIFKKLCK